jgi:predicted cobalt transporter CbtA
VFIAIAQLWGVAQGPAAEPQLPDQLIGAFVRGVYLANAVLWLSLGVAMGSLHRRMR